jgi:hypothetical protein
LWTDEGFQDKVDMREGSAASGGGEMNYAKIFLWSNGVLVGQWTQVKEESITRHHDGTLFFEAETPKGLSDPAQAAERRNFTVRGDYCVVHAAEGK